jgi:ferric-dicitrate binding protein FerR (iron transport regulator)
VIEQKQGLVMYDKNGETPVSIRALDLLINIDKGRCEVLVDKDTSDITVTVSTGSVTVAFNDINNNTNIKSISEGEKYLFNNDSKTGYIKSI